MEVLAWLEERSFEWDMYVDLPASSVRYCFRTLADATAFNSGSCMRRKGELSPAAIDRGGRTKWRCRRGHRRTAAPSSIKRAAASRVVPYTTV
jgi:hypothetical protein